MPENDVLSLEATTEPKQVRPLLAITGVYDRQMQRLPEGSAPRLWLAFCHHGVEIEVDRQRDAALSSASGSFVI